MKSLQAHTLNPTLEGGVESVFGLRMEGEIHPKALTLPVDNLFAEHYPLTTFLQIGNQLHQGVAIKPL